MSRIFELLVACRNGDPYLMAEMLVRYAQANSGKYEVLVCYCLGEIASVPHCKVEDFLNDLSRNSWGWNIDFHTSLALFKIFTRSEGMLRANNRPSGLNYAGRILPLTARMSDTGKLLCTIAFASQLVGPTLNFIARHFLQEYVVFQSEIRGLFKSPTLISMCNSVESKLVKLVDTNDYVGLCAELADQFTAAGDVVLAKQFLIAACTGAVATAQNDNAMRNLAVCFFRNGEHAIALLQAK